MAKERERRSKSDMLAFVDDAVSSLPEGSQERAALEQWRAHVASFPGEQIDIVRSEPTSIAKPPFPSSKADILQSMDSLLDSKALDDLIARGLISEEEIELYRQCRDKVDATSEGKLNAHWEQVEVSYEAVDDDESEV